MFTQEIKYCCIGIPLGLIILFFHAGSGIVIWLITFLLCRNYHQNMIRALNTYGPEKVLGIGCRGSWNYAVYASYLLKHLK